MLITKTPWSRYGNIWQYIVVFILSRVSGLSGGHPWIYCHVQNLKSRPQTGVSDTDRQQYIYHFHNSPDILIYSISSTSNKTLHCMITRQCIGKHRHLLRGFAQAPGTPVTYMRSKKWTTTGIKNKRYRWDLENCKQLALIPGRYSPHCPLFSAPALRMGLLCLFRRLPFRGRGLAGVVALLIRHKSALFRRLPGWIRSLLPLIGLKAALRWAS